MKEHEILAFAHATSKVSRTLRKMVQADAMMTAPAAFFFLQVQAAARLLERNAPTTKPAVQQEIEAVMKGVVDDLEGCGFLEANSMRFAASRID